MILRAWETAENCLFLNFVSKSMEAEFLFYDLQVGLAAVARKRNGDLEIGFAFIFLFFRSGGFCSITEDRVGIPNADCGRPA